MKLNMRVVLLIVGILIGSVAGLLYWKFIGCESGYCPISSSPYISTLYGAILGGLLFSIFRIEKKDEWQISVRYLFLFWIWNLCRATPLNFPTKNIIRSFLRFLPVFFPVFPRQIACYPPRKSIKISLKENLKPDPTKI